MSVFRLIAETWPLSRPAQKLIDFLTLGIETTILSDIETLSESYVVEGLPWSTGRLFLCLIFSVMVC
jgi:hypothetical protein